MHCRCASALVPGQAHASHGRYAIKFARSLLKPGVAVTTGILDTALKAVQLYLDDPATAPTDRVALEVLRIQLAELRKTV